MNNEFGFDSEFMRDDELQEMTDSILDAFGEQIEADERRTSVINPQRIHDVARIYTLMKHLTQGTRAKVEYKLHEPYTSTGVVTVVGSPITITNSEWFVKATEVASNFEIYPKTDGTVQINFGFHGLTTPIE